MLSSRSEIASKIPPLPATSQNLMPASGDSLHQPSNSAIESQKKVAYVLISIMSKLFQDEHTLHQIMKSIHCSYPSDTLPVVYICADTLQEITKPYLFASNSESTLNPVDREREKWKKKHDRFYEKEENMELKKDLVMWETLKSTQAYSQIRNFTDTVLCSKNQELSKYFPDLDERSLNDFRGDIENMSGLLQENINTISENFSSKNLQKIKKKTLSEKKEKEKLQKKLGSILRKDTLANELNLDAELSRITQGIKDATPTYLSEEFAAFILINYLNSSALIKDNLHIENFDEHITEILPELIYPISSSGQKAELTFSTFSMIEDLYIKYCESFSLPIISRRLTVTDVKVDTHINERSLKLLHDKTEKKENNNNHDIESPSTTSDSSTEDAPEKRETVVSSHWSTIYYSGSTQTSNNAARIAQKITGLISRHKTTGEKSDEIRYKNGITCTIKVGEKGDPTNEVPIDINTQLKALSKIIYDAVVSTLEDGIEEKISFVYDGYSFTLKTKKSDFEHDYDKKPNVLTNK